MLEPACTVVYISFVKYLRIKIKPTKKTMCQLRRSWQGSATERHTWHLDAIERHAWNRVPAKRCPSGCYPVSSRGFWLEQGVMQHALHLRCQ